MALQHSISRHLATARARAAAGTAVWKVFLALGVAMVVVYFRLPSVEIQNVAYQFPSMVATLAVLAGVFIHRPANAWPWYLLAAGLALSTAGDWTWVILEANGLEPFPSVADVLYLLGLGSEIAAILWMLRGRVPGGDRASLLDALIVGVGVGLVSWVFLMGPIVADTSQSFGEIAVALAYPVLDVVLLGVMVRLFLTPMRRMPALELLGAALVMLVLADFAYAVLALNDGYQTGQLVDAGWLLASILFGAAALHPTMREVADPVDSGEVHFSAGRLALLAAASLLAPAVLVQQWLAGHAIDVPVIAGGCVALFLLVIGRLGSVVNDLRTTLHQRRLLEGELERRALHDPLTGLANRTLFHERLQHALARRGEQVAVMFLDIDDFKTVNDAFGHQAGDKVLSVVADALVRVVRPADTVARLGGDEFAILLEDGPDMYAAGQIADRMLQALCTPTTVAGYDHAVGASIGIALGTSGSATAEELMRQADVAMYVAKGKGKGRFTVFEPTTHAAVVRGMELRGDLDRAIRDRQFELHYQPVMELGSGSVVGVEALVRWRHPSRGLLAPMEFIPLAEATGAIVPLGGWILQEACRQSMSWAADSPVASEWFMSVNVSAVQLGSADFAAVVGDVLDSTGMPSNRLVLEVTESTRLDRPVAVESLRALSALGVRLAIDDFGTGYASLSALSRSPFQFVKIDRSFVAAMVSEPRAESLIHGVVDLADHLRITSVAEGIEDAEQLARLRAMGCALGQGFYFNAPMMPAEIRKLLTAAAGEQRARVPRGVSEAPAT